MKVEGCKKVQAVERKLRYGIFGQESKGRTETGKTDKMTVRRMEVKGWRKVQVVERKLRYYISMTE